jgi:hypothetical protein
LYPTPKLIHEIQGLKKPGGTNGNKGRGRRKMRKGDILGVVKKNNNNKNILKNEIIK